MPATSNSTQLPKVMQEAIEWLVLLRSGEIDAAETHAFADWLSQDIAHAQAFAKAEDLFNDAAIAAQTPRVLQPAATGQSATRQQTEPASGCDKSMMQVRSTRLTSWLVLPLSFAAVWLIAVTLILPKQSHWLDNYLSDYHTRTGELKSIQLIDGSQILLNTNTAVSVDYSASTRHVTLLHGQAQFSVAKDRSRPFEVASGNLNIRALGTIFEVYHPGSGELTVTVLEHAVVATSKHSQKNSDPAPVEVEAGQRLRYDEQRHATETEAVNVAQASAWHEQKLFVNDRPLTEVITELERYRRGRIFITDPELKKLRVTGAFSVAHPDATISRICEALALQETRLGPWWIVLHR